MRGLKRTWWHNAGLDATGTHAERRATNVYRATSEEEANLIGSPVEGTKDLHVPTLDIDLPCVLRQSSTAGHYHLFIDKPMRWEQYRRLLEVLADVGIIEPGYYDSSIERGATFVRKPGLVKPDGARSS